jgi:hypothetical protein
VPPCLLTLLARRYSAQWSCRDASFAAKYFICVICKFVDVDSSADKYRAVISHLRLRWQECSNALAFCWLTYSNNQRVFARFLTIRCVVLA